MKYILFTVAVLMGMAYTGVTNQIFTPEVSDMIYAGYDVVVQTTEELLKKVKSI